MPIEPISQSPHDVHRSLAAPRGHLVGNAVVAIVAAFAFAWSYNKSYLLFHTLVELFSIVVAGCIFAIAWNSRRFHEDSSLLYLGATFLAVAAIDLMHAMAYRGMGVFPEHDANLPTQLWIAGRYIMAGLLMGFPLVVGRHIRPSMLIVLAGTLVVLVLLSIVELGIFPDCFVEGKGLTPFKRWSEYIICAMFVIAIGGILWRRDRMDRMVLILLVASLAVTVLQELCFTLYQDPYGAWNVAGHVLKIIAFFLVYKGIVETGLSRPYDLLFFDLKKHERALAASEAQYRQLVGNLHTAVVVHGPDTKIILSNPRASELLGLSADQMAGKVAMDPAWSFVREDGSRMPAEEYPVNHVIRSRQPLTLQVVGVNRPRRSGPDAHIDRVWVLVNAFPSVDAVGQLEQIVVTFVDITAQREADAGIRQSEARLRHFMDSSPVLMGLAELSEDGSDVVHVYGNPETCRFYGGESVTGRWLSDMGVPAEGIREIATRVRQSESEQRPIRFECLMTQGEPRQDADARLVEWVVSGAARGQTGRTRFCFVGQDITDRRAIELSLQAAKASAEEASKAKDHFISSLSHELRTPLTPVLAAVGVWRDEEKLPSDMRADLEMIERNIGLEVALISDLLDVTRIASGKLSMNRAPIDLADVVCHAAEICRSESITAMLDIDLKGAPYIVSGDSARLHQVFWNLIKNAIKFSSPGGRISIAGSVRAGDVSVSVTDTGVGISPAAMPRLFSAFEQGGRGATYGGLGLGLTIARGIIEAHGGRLSAHSEGENRGATFTVRLPLARPAVDGAPTPREQGQPSATPSSRAMRVLLVEDHTDTVRIVTRLLQRHGHGVVAANTAEDALALARVEHFDVMVSDLGLPDRSGIELMRSLRDSGSALPAIAMSGYGQPSDIETSLAAGFCSHLVKPVDPAQLLAAINLAGSGHARA